MELRLRVISVILNFLSVLLTPLYWIRSKFITAVALQPIRKPVFSWSARLITEKIRTGELTCEEVMHSYLFRCKRVNIKLNAVVEERYDEAMAEAEKMDEFLAGKTKSIKELEEEMPLLGVPISVSECCKVKGMRFSAGSVLRSKRSAECDGEAVKLLRKAGAIPVAVTNHPEFGMGLETSNLTTGVTNNPYNFHRTVGASAGGEAAMVSSAASVGGVASDFVGSLRLPAMFTGIFAHRPTSRCVSLEGHYPEVDEGDELAEMLVLGPLTRFAEDLPLMLSVMAGEEAGKLRLHQEVNVSDIKIFYMTDAGLSIGLPLVDRDIKIAIKKAVNFFQIKHNCSIQQATFKHMADCPEISGAVLFNLKNGPDMFKEVNHVKERPNLFKEVLRALMGQSVFSIMALQYQIIKVFFRNLPEDKIEVYKEKNQLLKKNIIDTLGDNAVLILPTAPSAAHYHHQGLLRSPAMSYSTIISSLGLPATHVPMGLNKNGLPIGFQVAAAPYQDRLCFAIARALETAYGGWIHPPCLKTPEG